MVGRKLFLITSLVALLTSCADILPLTGGDEDRFAPIPVKQTPEQASTLFTGNTVELTFNENIRLNDPANTVTMNPSVGKLTTTQKNRTVTVNWDGSLQPNTTYILQFNGTVRDLNEGNDSIMQVIFATGVSIDSLGFSGTLVNSFSNQTVGQATVGLYATGSDPSKEKPLYATRSDFGGEFSFAYLKPESFQLIAFVDQNKDQLLQPTEVVGFSQQAVRPGSTDSLTVMMYQPVPEKKQLKAELRFPGIISVSGRVVQAENIRLNNEKATVLKQITPDSVLIAMPQNATNVVRISEGTDTLTKVFTEKELKTPLSIRQTVQKTKWKQGDTLFFEVNAAQPALSMEAMTVMSEKGKVVPYRIIQGPTGWGIVPSPATIESFTIYYNRGAVGGIVTTNDSISFKYNTLLPADLSKLTLQCPDFEGQWVIQLLQGEKVAATAIKKSDKTTVVFDKVEAGQYNVRCIRDTNGNGIWDAGSLIDARQPEQVLRYTLTQKLRANWEIEETLRMKP